MTYVIQRVKYMRYWKVKGLIADTYPDYQRSIVCTFSCTTRLTDNKLLVKDSYVRN